MLLPGNKQIYTIPNNIMYLTLIVLKCFTLYLFCFFEKQSHGIPNHPFIINYIICIMCLQNQENRFAIHMRHHTVEDIIHSKQEAAAKKEPSHVKAKEAPFY